MRTWVVFQHPHWQCVAEGVPYLMEEGDVLEVHAPGDFRWKEGREFVIVHPHLSLPHCAKFRFPGVTFFETEQLFGSAMWKRKSEAIRAMCPDQPWLNFSAVGCTVFGDAHHPMRIHPELQVPRSDADKPIDVLFFGSMNERRHNVLADLKSRGLKVHALTPNVAAYGPALAWLIDRSRVLLNVHYYDPAMFECFRCVPAWHRGIPIVSETSLGNEGEEWATCVPYAELAGTVEGLVNAL